MHKLLSYFIHDTVCVIIFSIAILPKNWRRYTVPQSLTVIQWIADFSDRIQQLRQISQVSHSGSSKGLKVVFKHCSASRYRFVVGLKHPMEYGGAGPGWKHLFFFRTCVFDWDGCLFLKLTLQRPDSMLPKLTIGLWKNSSWRYFDCHIVNHKCLQLETQKEENLDIFYYMQMLIQLGLLLASIKHTKGNFLSL